MTTKESLRRSNMLLLELFLIPLHLQSLAARVAASDCRWTECQSNSLAETGCKQYNLTQQNIEDCDNGHKYYCCPDSKPQPPQGSDLKDCVWYACQPLNWTDRGCPPNMTQISSQSCGEYGDMFQCCKNKEETVEDERNLVTGESFKNFVKYLLLKGKNFTIQPDNLPCLSIDTQKESILQIKNEGIYNCDLCPYFPQERFVDVFLSNDPLEIEFNLQFPDCFGYCFDRDDCVAFSYDHYEQTCYMFNNTVGTFTQSPQWTTVFMTQPTGVLENWSYSRHTAITGEVFKSSKENNFKNCLRKCNENTECNYVSYSLISHNCSMITSQDKIRYIDLKFGFLFAFKITSIPASDVSSRFIQIGDDVFDFVTGAEATLNSQCSSFKNKTHSAFYSKSCFTSPGVGCDTTTGCRSCYYPENTNDYYNLVICPDSEWMIYAEIKETVQNALKSCLKDMSCVSVGYDPSTQESRLLSIENLTSSNFPTIFVMRYPTTISENQILIMNHDLLPGWDIERESSNVNSFQEIEGKSLKECFQIFDSSNCYIRMSYRNGKCKLSSEEVKYILKNNTVTVYKKPDIDSPILNYARTPGISIEESRAKQTFEPCKNYEINCATKCNEEFRDWCSHFMIRHDQNKTVCFFYDFFNDTIASNVNLQQKENTQIFTKLSNLDFTLDSINKLNPFQRSDIYSCFHPDSENQQTGTTLTRFDENSTQSTQNNEFQLRRKRGLFSFLKKAFKKVGDFIVNTVKDTVKGVVDTAKGIANTVVNVVKGDFKKAAKSFVNIPVVKDLGTAVQLGGAVITGNWEKAKEKGIELLQGETLGMISNLFPVGRLIDKGLIALGSAIKKAPAKIIRDSKRDTEKINENNKKVPEAKKDIDTERKSCKKRNKRATGKRSRPGKCDDSDDEDELCPIVKVPNVIDLTLSGCKNRKKNAICEYECEPGFQEPSKQVKCSGKGNQRPTWVVKPTCDKINCPSGPYPLIALQTPQVSSFGLTEFGKFITVYVVLFNKDRKLPDWTVALHQSTQFKSKDYAASKNVKRAEKFKPYPCPELANHQATPADYKGSGWDQGHLTPANIARWSEKARLTSNLFINIAPQDPFTNQGPWKRLETAVESFSRQSRSLVATGICRNAIGKAKSIEVPSCYWKMVCYRDEKSNEQVVGFMTSNSHPADKTAKDQRSQEVYRPLSQAEIKKILKAQDKNFKSPWIHASTIQTGRPVTVGGGTVWFPVNSYECEKAENLPEVEKKAWIARLPQKKSKTKKKTKRETSPEMKQEVQNISEFRNMESLLGTDLDEEDDEEYDTALPSEEDGESTLVNVQNCSKRMIGYYTSWGNKKISGRELKRLTHMIYAFLEMKEDGTVDVGSPDRKNAVNIDEEANKAKDRLENLMELAALHPHVKVMFAVGGWRNSQFFSAVAAIPQKRITFIASIVKMIQRYGLDGVDIHWEHPVTGGANEGIPQDKENYVNLMKEIRSALDTLAVEVEREEKFILSFAGAVGQWTMDLGYDLTELMKYADFVNVMSYDYFGAWENKVGPYTGPPSPLYFGIPKKFSGKTNVDWTVKYYTCKTQLPHKINMGVPFYGRFWKNVGQPVDCKDGMWRTVEKVNGTFQGGYKAWNEIPEFLETGGFEQHFHEKSKTPYAWNPNTKTFLGYENKKSLEAKVQYAVDKNVGGLVIWSVELDEDDLTLLNTVYQASLCDKSNPKEINYKCSPIDEKRWWTSEDGDDKAGLCGHSAPLYKGYYPVCDPDDPGYSCCGPDGYCGSGDKYCGCPKCKNYGENPQKILEQPIKPTVPETWCFSDAEEGKYGGDRKYQESMTSTQHEILSTELETAASTLRKIKTIVLTLNSSGTQVFEKTKEEKNWVP